MARKLQRARDKLDELQNFIEYDLTKVPTADGLINVDKMIWVRRQGKIQSLPDETRTTKVDLVVGISLLDSNALQRMEAKLLGLESGYGSLHNQQTHQQAATSHILAKQVELTDNVLPGILATQESTNRKIGELIQIYHSSQENRALSFPQPRPQERQQAHWNFRISFSHRNLACNLGCNCLCHSRSTWTTPTYLNSVIGLLFIRYLGSSRLNPKQLILNVTVQVVKRNRIRFWF